MDKVALCVQIVQGREQLPESNSEELFGEDTIGSSISQTPHVFPHRHLDETRVFASRTGNLEHFQGGPDVCVARMGMIALVKTLVDLKFLFWAAIADVDFQGNVLVRPRISVRSCVV